MNLKKLLKWKDNFISIILALIIPLTSCTGDKNKNEAEVNEESMQYEGVLKELENLDIHYNYEENYITKDRVEKIIEQAKNTSECPNKISTDYFGESDALFSKIKDNSKKYLEDHPEYASCFGLEDEKYYFGYSLYSILTYLVKDGTNNVAEDVCVLENLIVVDSAITDDAYAMYDKNKNIIYFDLNKMFYKDSNDMNVGADNIYKTVEHEINHVRQMACQHRANDEIKNIQYSNEVTTLIEAAAESAIIYENDYIYDYKDFFSYGAERKDEGLLFMLALFNESVTLEDYYNAIFDSNLSGLYEFYDLKSNEEIETFYKILYAIDTKNYRTSLFESWLRESNGMTIGEIRKRTGTSYLIDLFRLTLRRMVDYTYTHEEFSLENNIKMFVIVKSLILSDSYTIEMVDNELIKIYEPKFVENFKFLDELYVKFLQDNYKVSEEKIRVIENGVDTYELHNFHEFLQDSDVDIKKEFEANELIKQFPVLKGIVTTNFPSVFEYKSFLEQSNKSLKRSINH